MEPVFLFETILFYEGAPCFYKVYSADHNYKCEPQPHHYYTNVSFPILTISEEGNNWTVDGTNDDELAKHITKDLRRYMKNTLASMDT